MGRYLIRRLILLPMTLFFILLVNFCIINLAPGEPTTQAEMSTEGGAIKEPTGAMAFGSDMRYLQFRERYGLTLPVLINTWSFISLKTVRSDLRDLSQNKELKASEYNALRLRLGDQSPFIMEKLLHIMLDKSESDSIRRLANYFFIRGGIRQAAVGPVITEKEREQNRIISKNNQFLREQTIKPQDTKEQVKQKMEKLDLWYQSNKISMKFEKSSWELFITLFETRFTRYMKRILTLDFGTMRNDETKTVIQEVVKRFKYSLTLSVTPLILTFMACQFFGMVMAFYRGTVVDLTLNVLFLIFFSIPVFVIAPFLIEKIALKMDFPFTNHPFPISGFSSPENIYKTLPSYKKFVDIIQHITLPIIALTYGTLAASSRLSRTAFLEVMQQDYVKLAQAKGVGLCDLAVKHIGRNGSITIVTSLAGSLGVILGGSLIVETLFEIDGFGKFFYDAIINRDYNVMLFSALASSFLTLLGYLVADISYVLLDPRVSLE